MARYRKKPVVIEAFRLIIGNVMPDWLNVAIAGRVIEPIGAKIGDLHWGRDGVIIHTLEGDMTGAIGDWIIQGVRGELYPCKDEIFQETYEAVS